MLAVMRDDSQLPERRLEAAKAAAPYMHAKLQAIEHSGPNGGPIETEQVHFYLPDIGRDPMPE